MKKAVSLVGCIVSFVVSAHAVYIPITLTPESYNHDVVVEKTAPGPIQTLYTANMDAGTNIHGLFGGTGANHNTFYEVGFSTSGGAGLPYRGSLVYAVSDTNHVFRMPSNYSTNNAVFIGGSQLITTHIPSGSLTLATPAAFKKLSVLNAAGSGPATVSYTVNFQDGSSEQGTFVAYDWLSVTEPDTNTTAIAANGYFAALSGSFLGNAQRIPRLFYNDLTLVNSNGLVTRVDFSYTVDNRRVAIFGLSGSANGTSFTPLPVTGFNRDMIIESPIYGMVNATVDTGTNKIGTAFYETGFAEGVPSLGSSGLPHADATFTAVSNANLSFQMMPYTGNNAVILDTNIQFVITGLETPAPYKKLALLATGTGSSTINYTVIHNDLSSSVGSVSPQFWLGSTATNLAFMAGGRFALDRSALLDGGTGGKLFYYIITLSSTSPVSSINLAHSGSGRSMIFALSGDATGDGVFSPVALGSGFNADLVIEKEGGTNIMAKAFTTATVNGGTNNNNTSFYERGWNTLAPGSGLPLANSIISSTNLTDRQYQMAPSYTLPNAIYVHTNAPVAHITFANPTNYSSLSFLTTAGSGPVEIEVVVHFEGASSETNTLLIRDWFNSSAAAYTMAGSVVTDTRAASNWTPGTTSARLFDGLVPLENLVNKVTGLTIRWTPNNGSGGIAGGTRPFILAVSGIIPQGSPAINLQPTNSVAYSGSNVVLTVSGNGAPPLTFQWQAGAIGSGVFTNLSNSGNISGANANSLTFSGINLYNNANYRVVIGNGLGAVTSSVVRVTAISTLPNVLRTNDAVQMYGGTASNISSENVTNAINGNLSKYLNFGVGTNLPPFEGPVGLTVTPGVGHTVVSAVRIFAATDTPERDPADFQLEGSNDGTLWTLIASNSIALLDERSAFGAVNPLIQNHYESHFANTTPYLRYRIAFYNVKTNATANSVQIGELQLLGIALTNPPVITKDIPAAQLIYIGDNLVLSTEASSVAAFTYQWKRGGVNLVNGGKISGAQTNVLTITSVGTEDAGSYQLFMTNMYGYSVSTLDVVAVEAAPEFNGNGVGWARNGLVGASSSPPTISGNVLALTTGNANTVRSAFLNARQNITAFLATFTYQNPTKGGADGAAFILHNDPRGTTALGAAGSALGVSGITPSLSLQFNIYAPNGIGMALNTNGAIGNIRSTSPVSLISGNPINVTVNYDGGLLAVTLNDTVAGTSFSTNWVINLPAVVGGNAAYVGFSGATGGVTSTQNIINFQFTAAPIISTQESNGTALFSWPAIGGCVLQSSSDLSPTNWVTVSDPLTVANATFQLNTSVAGTNKFYRLKITNP